MVMGKKEEFKDLLCKVIHTVFDDEHVKDHKEFCKELSGIPVYKNPGSSKISESSHGSKIGGNKISEEFNEMLIIQAQKENNKVVFSGACYEIIDKEKKLVYDPVIIVIRAKGGFDYEIQLSNESGYLFLRKVIHSGLTYEVNTDEGYVRWLQIDEDGQGTKIIEVNFGKRDAAMSFKFAIIECLYEINTKKSVKDSIAPEDFSYVKQIGERPDFSEQFNKKVVKTYEDKEDIQEISEKVFYYGGEEAHKGLEKYRTLCQGKVHKDVSVASLGEMLELLKISSDNEIEVSFYIILENRKN